MKSTFAPLLIYKNLIILVLLFSFSNNINAQISGTVFRDLNINGLRENTATFKEPYIQGVIVKAYDSSNVEVGSVTTNASGAYSFTGLTLPLRIEFSGFLNEDFSAPNSAANATSVQFYTAATTNANYTVNYPQHYTSSTNPDYFVSQFEANRPPASEPLATAMLKTKYTSRGQTWTTNTTSIAKTSDIGGTWGLAFDRQRNLLYAAAFVKRHASMKDNNADGKEDLGAIYSMTPTGSPVLWQDLSLLGIDFGASLLPTIASRNLPTTITGPSHDAGVFSLVGKIGIGDIEVSDDFTKLYVVNLYDSKIYTIDLASKTLISTSAAIPSPCSSSGIGNARPFAIKYHRGRLFVSSVCDASVSNLPADLNAKIYSFDGSAFTEVLAIPLNYTKGYTFKDIDDNNSNGLQEEWGKAWNPWSDVMPSNLFITPYTSPPSYVIMNPQPMLVNIEFDLDESLILVFNDRFGHQAGQVNYGPNTSNTSDFFTGLAAGDLLRASYSGGAYTLENGGIVGGLTGNTTNNNGPGGGEFYHGDHDSNSYHAENIIGGSMIFPGKGEVAVIVTDPIDYFTGGTFFFDNTNGDVISSSNTDRYQLYQATLDNTKFGKVNGLGDMEMVSALPSLEIGNRVFMDTDSDGIQDADEMGLDGVKVELWKAGSKVTETTTANGGQWYFSNVDANTNYEIKILAASFPSGKSLTTSNVASNAKDLIDNDAALVGSDAVIAYKTGSAGQNNHSLDFGFKIAGCTTFDVPQLTLGSLSFGSGTAPQAENVTTNGSFPLSENNIAGFLVDPSSEGIFYTFCTEISQPLLPLQNPYTHELNNSANGFTTNQALRIAQVMQASGFNSTTGFGAGNNTITNMVAMQMAVWNAFYDTDYSVSVGNFQLLTDNNGAKTQANTWLTSAQAITTPNVVVHRLHHASGQDLLKIGDVPPVTVIAVAPTCTGVGSPNNAGITITEFTTGMRYQYTSGTTFSGTATPSGITTIPAGGVIATSLPNTNSTFTVRVYDSADDNCYVDRTVTLVAIVCCTPPSAISFVKTPPTCNSTTSNNDGKITFTSVSNADKYFINTGATSTGTYATAANIPATGTDIQNSIPNAGATYTIRFFNGSDACFKDTTITINAVTCNSCACPGNLLENPSFETSDFTSWTLSTNDPNPTSFAGDNTYAACGNRYAYFNPTSGNSTDYVAYYQDEPVSPGSVVSLSVYSGVHDPTQNHQIKLEFYSASNTLLSGGQTVQVDNDVDIAPTTLQQYTLSGTAPTGTAYVRITARAEGAYVNQSIAIKVDAFCMTATPGCNLTASATGTNVSCNAGTNGTSTATPTGNTGAVTYLWSNAATTASITTLAAGTYNVTVTESANCIATANYTVTEPSDITLACAKTDVTTTGGNDGAATVTATGGTSPYTYLWSDGSTTASITGLTAGTYTVTVTDAKGCSDVCGSQVNEPGCVKPNAGTDQSPACVGNTAITTATLAATAVNGGVWTQVSTNAVGAIVTSPSSATSGITGLNPGVYQFIWSTSVGCADTVKITIPTCQVVPPCSPNIFAYWSFEDCSPGSNTPNDGMAVTSTNLSGCSDLTVTELTRASSGNSCQTKPDGSLSVCMGSSDDLTWIDNNNKSIMFSLTYPAGSVGKLTSINFETSVPSKIDFNLSGGTNLQDNNYPTKWGIRVLKNGIEIYKSIDNPLTVDLWTLQNIDWVNNSNFNINGADEFKFEIMGYAPVGISGTIREIWDLDEVKVNGYCGNCACTKPSAIDFTTSAPTCTSATANNDGKITFTNVSNADKYFINSGTTSTGTYATALTIPMNGTVIQNNISNTGATYTIRFFNGSDTCFKDTTITINAVACSCNLTASATGTNVSCKAGTNGTATATPTGNTGAVTYVWSNGATTASLTGLTAGTYNVTVTESVNCTATANYTITEPSDITLACAKTDVTTTGGSNGTTTVTATGGTSPYTYLWSNGATTGSITGLTAGTYTVTVTDTKGCSDVCSSQVNEPGCNLTAIATGTNVSCNAGTDGTATATLTGNTGAVTYIWSNGATMVNITSLSVGTYTVTVTESANCTATVSYTVTEPSDITLACAKTDVTTTGGSDGTATVTATGGTSPYTYLWSNGATTASITGLTAGTYTVTVTDAKGCSEVCSSAIVEPICTQPTVGTNIPSAGTCNGTIANDDAQIVFTGFTNADKADKVIGATYTGVAYNAATLIVSSGALTVTGLKHNTQYTFRFWNGADNCYIDVTVTTPTKNCTSPCPSPSCGSISVRKL